MQAATTAAATSARNSVSSVGSRGFGEESGCTKERSAANRRVPVGYRDDVIDPEVLGKRRKQVRYDSGCGGVLEGGGKVFGTVRNRSPEATQQAKKREKTGKEGTADRKQWGEIKLSIWEVLRVSFILHYVPSAILLNPHVLRRDRAVCRRHALTCFGDGVLGVRVRDAEGGSKCGGCGTRNAADGMRKKDSKCGGCGCGTGLEMRRMRMWNGTRNAMDAEMERELGMRWMRKWKGNSECDGCGNGKGTRNAVDAEAKRELGMRKILRESAGAGDDVSMPRLYIGPAACLLTPDATLGNSPRRPHGSSGLNAVLPRHTKLDPVTLETHRLAYKNVVPKRSGGPDTPSKYKGDDARKQPGPHLPPPPEPAALFIELEEIGEGLKLKGKSAAAPLQKGEPDKSPLHGELDPALTHHPDAKKPLPIPLSDERPANKGPSPHHIEVAPGRRWGGWNDMGPRDPLGNTGDEWWGLAAANALHDWAAGWSVYHKMTAGDSNNTIT
ncbi:hypothetical protein FIBSPDRAFT_892222 [Athelia psychrophila]|uniref:Uncharacterized protein n=1 Tax=Athelia psychrophila TaxID=1759441 RepID=A0A166IPJ9_9AGAM|nr:hypothetical protein FIBSPDRAFT_892222 [Fibularhizoctonia sp. CBS 109695]